MSDNNRPQIVIEYACAYCRQLTGHAPTCLIHLENLKAASPCTWGLHRWALLSSGGQVCGRCGVHR